MFQDIVLPCFGGTWYILPFSSAAALSGNHKNMDLFVSVLGLAISSWRKTYTNLDVHFNLGNQQFNFNWDQESSPAPAEGRNFQKPDLPEFPVFWKVPVFYCLLCLSCYWWLHCYRRRLSDNVPDVHRSFWKNHAIKPLYRIKLGMEIKLCFF